MEPTPELKTLARNLIGPGATESEHSVFVHALMVQAKELREALLPFERAAELSPAKRQAIEHARQALEQRRRLDEELAQSIGSDKPPYQPKQPWWRRLVPASRSAK